MHNILNELKAAALLTAMENQKDGIEEVFSGKRKSLKLDLSDIKDMTFAGNFPTANAAVTTVQPGVVPLTNRLTHVRDLVRQGIMSGSNYAYIKETSIVPKAGSFPVDTSGEGEEKQNFDVNYSQVLSPAQWIAGYLVCSRNMMDDIVAFSSYLEGRLTELLLAAEDRQLLTGDGTSPNISGITNTGNFTASSAGGAVTINTILSDMGQLASYKRDVNGVLLNDQTYFDLLVSSTNAAISTSNGQMYIAGIPVFKNQALDKGSSIVGDWANGANLLVREPARVEFFYEDSNNVRKNNVTVRVEERIAFPIYANNYFVYKAG